MRYLSAHYIFPISAPPLRNGVIYVNDDGCIVDVSDTGGKLEEREKLEFYNGILVPGFVNAHCHLELSHLRGALQPHGGLPAFISSIVKMRPASDGTIKAAAKTADEEMTKNGIVAAGDISNSADTLSIKRNSRIRYHTFVELFGLDGNRAKEIFTMTGRVKQEYDNAGLSVSVAPHAAYSVSQALWEILHQSYLASPPQVISMHHQESSGETGIYFEGKDELTDTFRTTLLQAQRCLLVHNTFTSKDNLIKYIPHTRRFYFVLCPGSNLFIQNRLPDFLLYSLQKLCQTVCLGTDSLASNTRLSILDEMKIIRQHAPDIPLETLLRWATLNGAQALGFDRLLGSFEKGKTPGVNLISGIDFDRMQLTDESMVKVLS